MRGKKERFFSYLWIDLISLNGLIFFLLLAIKGEKGRRSHFIYYYCFYREIGSVCGLRDKNKKTWVVSFTTISMV